MDQPTDTTQPTSRYERHRIDGPTEAAGRLAALPAGCIRLSVIDPRTGTEVRTVLSGAAAQCELTIERSYQVLERTLADYPVDDATEALFNGYDGSP